MDPEVKSKWLKQEATRSALQTAQNNRMFVMPAPKEDFNPHYGNFGFGWINGFEAAIKLLQNGGDLYETPPTTQMQEDWSQPGTTQATDEEGELDA